MRTRHLLAALCAAAPVLAHAQAPDTTALTSLSGIYTAEQAKKGENVYGAACLSCHKTVEFTGERFWNTLVNRPLWDFFKYLKSDMPQDNPGSLGDEDYTNVISYIFTLNAMPAGQRTLPADSATLAKIKVVPPTPAGPRTSTRYTWNHQTGRGK
jgi:mono/diheme cytochrome c family protein